MTRRTLYTALLALFVGGSAGVSLQAQTQEQDVPVAQNEPAPDGARQPVTVHVRNQNWLSMRIYVGTHNRGLWPLGSVAGAEHGELRDPRPPAG